jgi:hypothetical protein
MSTALYRSNDLADRIESLLAEPDQPRNDALFFTFEVLQDLPAAADANVSPGTEHKAPNHA